MSRILIILILFLCNSCTLKNNRGFKYPSEIKDSSYYFSIDFKLDIKDSIVLYSTSEYFKKVGLQNLSLGWQGFDIYRFVYLRAFHEPYFITLYNDSIIIVKDFDWIEYNYEYDLTRLTKKEQDIYELWGKYKFNRISIDRKYPDSILKTRPNLIKSINKNKRANDSLIRICPLIADTDYMNKLDSKAKITHVVNHKAITKKVLINSKIYNQMLKSIEGYGFWRMKNTMNALGVDGSDWILEANTEFGYYFVFAWEPDGDFKKLCMEFLKYTDLKKNEIY